jgi:hypothetical protein
MSACGPKQTCRKTQSMSLLGIKRTYPFALQMSAERKTDAMSNDDENWSTFTRRRNSDVSKNFHRLGMLVAALILTAGLLLMVKDALGLRLGDLIPADIPILAGGIAIGLTGIGLVSLAAYGIVRAIGWAIGKSI